ncbi:Uncharacterised protein [Clostridium fallax]|uniref:hypothetical protein n=1 Tax=Clostridium fallax TaxID=1533 RepID=UPI000D8EA564|nr:hypothetical protein [Clostridium fallax]SQB06545.1 Uncharacterised protein [Clostridium fallax]
MVGKLMSIEEVKDSNEGTKFFIKIKDNLILVEKREGFLVNKECKILDLKSKIQGIIAIIYECRELGEKEMSQNEF